MSKMDNLRAMREARYAANQAGAKPTAPATRPTRPAVAPEPTAPASATAPDGSGGDPGEQPVDDLCGHRNMGGRTGTREKGHAAKSHRYS